MVSEDIVQMADRIEILSLKWHFFVKIGTPDANMFGDRLTNLNMAAMNAAN